ncbi:uncharacterized protein LOC113351623 [Papaver somniferum]|uniref:uncharacterized protein LOC113351623 n=1 Tax=Papaver somniferum TaxID=3469 RepID=UPI000E70174B|nr:uncharacterized protein LOC113351623 [Papaver somniferum]
MGVNVLDDSDGCNEHSALATETSTHSTSNSELDSDTKIFEFLISEDKEINTLKDDLQRLSGSSEKISAMLFGGLMDSFPKTTLFEGFKSDMLGFNKEKNSQVIPSIKLPDDLFEESIDPWRFSLIGRLNLQQVKFVDAVIRLRRQWKLTGDCKLIPLGRGFFTIKLDNEIDRQYIKEGKWEVLNHVLQVRKWISNFRPEIQRTSKAMVWVRLPGLGLEFWSEKILFKICKEIGTPIKLDEATARCEVGYYANVLVEIYFAKSVPNKVVKAHIPFDNDRSEVDKSSSNTSRRQSNTSNNANTQVLEEDVIISNIVTPVNNVGNSIPANISSGRFNVLNQAAFEQEDDTSVDEEIIAEREPIKQLSNTENPEVESVVKFVDVVSGRVSQVDKSQNHNMGDNIEDQSGILEVPKLIKLAEENRLQNSTVTFVNGSNGNVTNEVVQVTSWAKLVEKEMVTGSSSSSPSKTKVSKPVPVNNKYNFRKNQNKGGMKKMVIHNSTSDNKGNIWLFWNASITQPTVISMSSQMVTVSVGDVLVSGVHAHVKLVQRRFLWSEMEMISEMNKP